MNQDIYKSLTKITEIESKQNLSEAAAAAPVAQAAGKGIGRFIPGVGAAIGAYDAYNRAKQGDWAGAGLSALGGAAALVPGIGTAASLGIAGAQAARDKARTGSYLPSDDEIAAAVAKDKQAQPAQAAAPAAAKPATAQAAPAGANPKVLALQKQLIAQGAKIKADGIMGPQTQAAMKQFAVAESIKEEKMTESERIAALRSKLQQLDENPLNLAKSAWQGAKNIGSAFRAGVADPAGAKALAPAATKAGEKAALRTGAAVAGNPGKVAAAGTAAGAAGMAALGGGAATKPAAPAKPAAGGAAKPKKAPAAPANALPDPKEVEELNQLAASLENSQDPADIELLKRYSGIINAINNRAPGDKRTQGEIAASAALKDAGV